MVAPVGCARHGDVPGTEPGSMLDQPQTDTRIFQENEDNQMCQKKIISILLGILAGSPVLAQEGSGE